MKRIQLRRAAALATLFAAGAAGALAQQNAGSEPFRLGIFGGAVYNRVAAPVERLSGIAALPGVTATTWPEADGATFYGGAFAELHLDGPFALHLRAAYDLRGVRTASSAGELTAHLGYLSFEPGLRFALGGLPLHLLAGPSGAFAIRKRYDFIPSDGDGAAERQNQELAGVRDAALGVWGELGYDIALTSPGSAQRWYLTPFAGASYLFDQVKSSTDDRWSTLTLRGGIRIGAGQGAKRSEIPPPPDPPGLTVSVQSPRNGVVMPREVTDRLPLLGSIFFDEGSAEIPSRYYRLTPDSARTFSESWLFASPQSTTTDAGPGAGPGTEAAEQAAEPLTPAARQMSLYHHALNILGSRMVHRSESRVRLVGAAPDRARGLAMASAVREYLTSTFGIDSSRIDVEGTTRPPHASGTRATPKDDLPLVAEENLRVEILSDDQELLKPVTAVTLEQTPYDNDLVVTAKSVVPVEDWIVTISGEGYTHQFGPYYYPKQRIPAASILGGRPWGSYRATVLFRTKEGEVFSRQANFELKRTELPPVGSNRYSILFEFDESKTVAMYEEFLRTEVAPKIPNGATVFVHGHTDVVGEEGHNFELSARRAAITVNVLEEELRKLGRSAVFDSYGFGEDELHVPFINELPEGRYYNRTVMIEIVPGT